MSPGSTGHWPTNWPSTRRPSPSSSPPTLPLPCPDTRLGLGPPVGTGRRPGAVFPPPLAPVRPRRGAEFDRAGETPRRGRRGFGLHRDGGLAVPASGVRHRDLDRGADPP